MTSHEILNLSFSRFDYCTKENILRPLFGFTIINSMPGIAKPESMTWESNASRAFDPQSQEFRFGSSSNLHFWSYWIRICFFQSPWIQILILIRIQSSPFLLFLIKIGSMGRLQSLQHDDEMAATRDLELWVPHVPEHHRGADLQRPESVPRLPLGHHQLRERRAGPQLTQQF